MESDYMRETKLASKICSYANYGIRLGITKHTWNLRVERK